MGFFKSIKKAFKKIIKGVKKVVKKVVKGVKKVVKKIGSSKILKALAIAAAIVVTGGAALTAFGGTGTLASSTFGQWMMTTSQNVLGGSLFGTGGGFLAKTGNFVTKTLAKPFGAVGGAIGSTARVGANIVHGKDLLAAGPGVGGTATTPGAIITAPTPFSAEAFSGQLAVADTVSFDPTANAGKGGYINTTVDPTDPTKNIVTPLTPAQEASLPNSYTSNIDKVTGKTKSSSGLKVGDAVTSSAIGMGFGLTERAIANKYFSEDPRNRADSLFVEGKSPLDPIRVYASENNINFGDIYSHGTYGTGDPAYMMNTALFSQETIGSPTAIGGMS